MTLIERGISNSMVLLAVTDYGSNMIKAVTSQKLQNESGLDSDDGQIKEEDGYCSDDADDDCGSIVDCHASSVICCSYLAPGVERN